MTTQLDRWTPNVLSTLRIFTGLLLLAHGTAKILGFPAVSYFAKLQLTSLNGIAGFFELIGGALLLLGLFTRPVAFVMAGFAAAAYFIGHAGKDFFPIVNGGEVAALLCFVCLYFIFSGPGPWSLDAAMKRA